MYSEKRFVDKYANTNNDLEKYIDTTVVEVGKKIVHLKDYMERKDISKDDINIIHESITGHVYLKSYYKKSMNAYGMTIKHDPMSENEYNNNSKVQYKNIIRNMHYEEIMENTTPGTKNSKSFGIMLNDLYKKNIIDYKILTPSALHYIRKGRIGSVYSSYYFRSSIMNPFLVYSVNQSLLHGKKIFTPTLGWTSYCYGFMECDSVTEYVGTDVIASVCDKTRAFASTHYSKKKCEILDSPSEDLLKNKEFMSTYENYFDTVFFSPPYFELEKYSGENQSINRYKTYSQWLKGYWKKTVELCVRVMTMDANMCYIIGDYGTPKYNLIQDTLKICEECGLTLVKIQPMFNKGIYVTNTSNLEQIIHLIKTKS